MAGYQNPAYNYYQNQPQQQADPYGQQYGHQAAPYGHQVHYDESQQYYSDYDQASLVHHGARPAQTHPLQRQQGSYDTSIEMSHDNYRGAGGNAPARKKSVRHVELTRGNLVLDCEVPSKVLQGVKYTTGEEFTHMRYTAATCDPDDFGRNEYKLRPHLYGRRTELFIVMTMYNEDDVLFIKTMSSVIKNIGHLCSRNKSKVWGSDGWQKVVVCVVADGRNKVHPRTLKVLGAMGAFQEDIMKDNVAGKPVTAHLFEYTSQLMVHSDLRIRGGDIPPVQILFCLKEKNAKKLNSHRWFFNAFAQQLNPNVCVLLDVGTKPSGTSIYHLWKAFDRDSSVGGACGEICAELGRGWLNLLNPIVASQNFEYKMSNILDKPLESVFGYISVLPGAFSAYRYKALMNITPDKGPLASYFKGEALHGGGAADAGIFESNMYLAEDRILCFELVAKKHEGWKLKYVKSAKAETDVPDNLPEFISQRRRWLNGSFFAAFYSLVHCMRIWGSGQPFTRKILLMLEFTYNAINLFFNWFALGNFYLTFFFLTQAATQDHDTDPFRGYGVRVFTIVRELYLTAIITILVSSLGNRPQGSKFLYLFCVVLFAIIMGIMLYCAGYTVLLTVETVPHVGGIRDIKRILAQAPFRDIVISLASTYGLYFFSSFIHGEPWHMFTSFVQYILLLPSYVNILMVYAFCNTHDVSWGTKGDNSAGGHLGGAKPVSKDGKDVYQVELPYGKDDINAAYEKMLRELQVRPKEEKQHRDAATKKEDYYKLFRTRLVLVWMFSNALLVIFFTSTIWLDYIQSKSGATAYNPYLTVIFWSVAGLSAVRMIGCVLYLVLRLVFG